MKRYRLDAGRLILRDGVPFVVIKRRSGTPELPIYSNPVEADQFARDVVRAINHVEALEAAVRDLVSCAEPHRDRVEIKAARDALLAYRQDKGNEYSE